MDNGMQNGVAAPQAPSMLLIPQRFWFGQKRALVLPDSD
jgi:hypothetical protein